MDDIDRKLINLLMRNARQSSEILSKQLMISSAAVRRRLDKLLNEGRIRIAAIPDPMQIDFKLRVYIALNVVHEKLGLISSQLASRSEIVFLVATSGRFDLIAMAWFSSTDNRYDFIYNVVEKLEGVNNVETFIYLRSEKSCLDNKS